jgi:hypothetical protein
MIIRDQYLQALDPRLIGATIRHGHSGHTYPLASMPPRRPPLPSLQQKRYETADSFDKGRKDAAIRGRRSAKAVPEALVYEAEARKPYSSRDVAAASDRSARALNSWK